MSDTNKTYRIRVGENIGDAQKNYLVVPTDIVQDYETFEILSLKIDSSDAYKLHNSNYGAVVGRVLANNGFGIPNAKISIFIQAKLGENTDIDTIYPFSTTVSKNEDGVRYNLLPDEKVSDCHQIVGTFPNKRYALDNEVILEVFDKYYKYTTRTNNAGDYLIMGVPTGAHTIHMDLDLSDCGILSQRPRDFVYKGYTIEQFENPNMFKSGTEYSNLSQVFTQDQVVNVQPLWGNTDLGETIGLSRADINVAFKFEPTCIFMGSIGSDNASQGIAKKCIPTPHMGEMDEMVTGEGTIEMIRKTPGGNVEEFEIKGTQLINSDGVWCYQIPMNLDYMMTDEYGNMVPTDNPEMGLPTRASVRFRISMQDAEENTDNYFRPKVLVPHNPQNTTDGLHENYDYEFGSNTREDSFRDLFWNNVYSVKSYIPRIQKRIGGRAWKEKRFTGIKHCNYYGSNNPIPYNNIRIKLPFMFVIMCIIFKCFIFLTGIINFLISATGTLLTEIGKFRVPLSNWYPFEHLFYQATTFTLNVLREGICPDAENWYFAPMFSKNLWEAELDGMKYNLVEQTIEMLRTEEGDESGKSEFQDAIKGRDDRKSIDYTNNDKKYSQEAICLTINTDYLVACVEMNLAQEYRVINFDFYNDWINGFIYIPRFMRYIRPKIKFLGIVLANAKIKGCMDNTSIFSQSRRYSQLCSLGYKSEVINDKKIYTSVRIIEGNNLHKNNGYWNKYIFGGNGGICHEQTTSKKQSVYYLKPCEWTSNESYGNVKVNLFATDIILLGSLNDCDLYGIPQAFKHLSSSSYIMPTNLALTNMDTNGPLYANGDDTICVGTEKETSTTTGFTNAGSGITELDITTNGLSTEVEYYNNSKDKKSEVVFEAKEPSDTIALTEAAGISWNWTGPGQGEVNEDKFYYPGGHFLGLSCINSQTNMKSCINLERICEIGSTMSQRKEEVYGYDDKKNKLHYAYTVPTGFISGDEIVDTDFRTMFSTMNRKRLIATKTSQYSGYKIYDFTYLRPSNFDGALKEIVSNGPPYNTKVEVYDESSALEKYDVLNASERGDYDENEVEKTQTRTRESTSFDYYMFKFGYTIDDLNKGNMQERRFLRNDGGIMYLPQYENSFYFYFGMKFGATAIDEFNKEFFSNCDTQMISVSKVSLELNSYDVSLEDANGSITAVTNNMETPFNSIEWKNNDNPQDPKSNGKETIYQQSSPHWEEIFKSGHTSFSIENLPFGNYTITVVDNEGTSISKSISIGLDLISYQIEKYDYNTTRNESSYFFRGGYINISNLQIKTNSKPQSVKMLLTYNKGSRIVTASTINVKLDSEESAILSGVSVSNYQKSIYDLRLKVNSSSKEIILSQIKFNHPGDSNLFIGFNGVASANVSTDKYLNTGDGFKTGWWENKITTSDSLENWLYKKCFFDTNLRRKGAFNANLFTNNGEKLLWGYAQNAENSGNGRIYFSKDYTNIPEGYIVNDEKIYWPIVIDRSSKLKQYSSMVLNNMFVGCDYHGTTDNISSDDKKYYTGRTPCGYIFKDLTINELEYRILGDGHDSTLTHNYPNNKGVYYPTFIFPILDRQFSARTDAFVWENISFDTSEENEIMINTEELGFIISINVVNGITNNGNFSNNSIIEYLVDKETKTIPITFKYGNDELNENSQKNDLYGLLDGKNNFRKYLNIIKNDEGEFYANLKRITATIEEWYPINEKIEKYKNSLGILESKCRMDVSSSFYDRILFKLYKSFLIKRFGPFSEIEGIGLENSAKYFICEDPNNEVILNEHKALTFCWSYFWFSCDLILIACTYNEKAQYENEGVETIAWIGLSRDILRYEVLDPTSEVGKVTKEIQLTNEDLFNALVNDQCIDGLWPYEAEVSPIYKATVITDEEKISKDLVQTIERQKVNEGDIYFSDRKYYGVGVISGSTGCIWKLYPNAKPIIEKKKYSPFKVSPTSLNLSYEKGEFKLSITASTAWTASTSETNWILLDGSTQKSGESSSTIKVTYEKNDDIYFDRECTITVESDGYVKDVKIHQEKNKS